MRRAKVGPEKKPVDSLFDLVLTFDYENLNTPIEDVARQLKGRLEAVGLGPEHGKELTTVAHSMGGLVSRWFIEREEGNKVVQRLVMCGTPNGGSPWPDVHDWALSTLAIGLNGLATLAWPAAVVGGLVAAIERVDVDLDQMQPGSPFLKELTRSPDPSVPYVMLAGNTSLAPAALVVDANGLSPAGRLLARLLSKPILHGLADTLFRDQANDVAVSVLSMRDVPGPWKPAYDVRAVACDHMSYFRHTAGLAALATALSQPIERQAP
jgi:pimeloyl-ACP methyl ester carboxylesterase